MTMIRRIATEIVRRVAEFSPPEGKEWARASASEVEEIAGDWAALAWAVGSVQLVFQRPETEDGSRRGLLGSLRLQLFIFLPQIFVALVSIATAHCLSERIGWCLVGFGWSYWCSASVIDSLRERNAPPLRDLGATRIYLREKLRRRLRRYRSMWRWSSPLVTIAMCSGLLMVRGGPIESPIFTSLLVAFGGFAIWMQCLETPEKIQGRIDRLEERMAEKDSGEDLERSFAR